MTIPTTAELDELMEFPNEQADELLKSLNQCSGLINLYAAWMMRNKGHNSDVMHTLWAATALGFQLGYAARDREELEKLS